MKRVLLVTPVVSQFVRPLAKSFTFRGEEISITFKQVESLNDAHYNLDGYDHFIFQPPMCTLLQRRDPRDSLIRLITTIRQRHANVPMMLIGSLPVYKDMKIEEQYRELNALLPSFVRTLPDIFFLKHNSYDSVKPPPKHVKWSYGFPNQRVKKILSSRIFYSLRRALSLSLRPAFLQ